MSADAERDRLPASAIGTALIVAAIWGFNFVVIKVGVSAVPPLFLAALRFLFSALPAVFLVRRPAAPLRSLAAYGLLLGVGEFGFLFTAIKLGAPAGLSSILLQSQAFFTALLVAAALKERLRARNVAGMAVAAAGLALFAASAGAGSGGLSLPLLGMILLAALGWAGANIQARRIPPSGALGLMAWSSLFAPLPMAALSLIFVGPAAIASSMAGLSWLTVGALAYLVILSTLVGYGRWNALIARHGASRIALFSLLVPVFSLASTSLLLGERIGAAEVAGSVLILAGLLVHALGGRIRARGGA